MILLQKKVIETNFDNLFLQTLNHKVFRRFHRLFLAYMPASLECINHSNHLVVHETLAGLDFFRASIPAITLSNCSPAPILYPEENR